MRQYIPLLFFAIFIALLVAANFYLIRRFNWYFSIERTRLLLMVFPPFTLLIFFGVMPLSNTTNSIGSLVYMISAVAMGGLLYIFMSVLAVDLLRLVTNFSPRIYGFIVLFVAFSISIGGILNSWNIQVSKQVFKMKGLSKEIRAMHLTDIHLGHFRGEKFLQKIVDKTNQQNVDMVFITGDLFDGVINLNKEALAPLKQLCVPIYFVEGNHDKYSRVQTVKKYLREMNIHVLENQIAINGELQIIGLNHMVADSKSFSMHASAQHSTIQETLQNLSPDKNRTSLLLHHSPDGIKYANEHGIDLYLAGHTHAGQIFPIKYIANLMFAYNKGLHNYNGTKIFVSQGVGTFGPPMRVGTKSEIVVITLKPE